MHVREIDTPAIVIDLDIFERNLARLRDYAAAHNLRARPHTKTHKAIEVARAQLAHGAAGLTVAKTGEAEVMADSGTTDLLIQYPVIGRAKLDRLAAVAKRVRVTVALDSAEAARGLSEAATANGVTFGVLSEFDAGLGRVGVDPSELVPLAKSIASLPGLELEGFTCYPGHLKTQAEAEAGLAKLGETITAIRAEFDRAGLPARIVSGGSTPMLWRSHEVAGLTEIRPGTYVYNDVNTVWSGAATWEDCAAMLHVTVVSTPREGHMVIDGGSKTFSSDGYLGGGARPTHGRIVEAPEAVFYRMNEEHGYVDTREAGRTFSIGERLRVIPNHICVAVNLHDRVFAVRGETVEAVWSVAARGRLQ